MGRLGHTLKFKTISLWNFLEKKYSVLTSVASTTAAGHAATPAAPKAAVGLPELLTGLPSLASQHQRSATLTDRSTVIPTSASTCQHTQHTFDMMWSYALCGESECVTEEETERVAQSQCPHSQTVGLW